MKSILFLMLVSLPVRAAIVSKPVSGDLTKADPLAKYWENAPTENVTLMAQPMITPKPKKTETSAVRVQSVNDGKWISFRLRWKDGGVDLAGKLAKFSDAAAIEFPIKSNTAPPPVFMGAKDNPVHIYHWRAQYQQDAEKGKPQPKDLYPNLSMDMYPMDYHDPGHIKEIPAEKREVYNPAVAVGNPQAYSKSGIDEIYAEGFATSSVRNGNPNAGKGVWKNSEWTLVISRPLAVDGGSSFEIGKGTFAGFAIWQGGAAEVGSRKSVTMTWIPVQIEGGAK